MYFSERQFSGCRQALRLSSTLTVMLVDANSIDGGVTLHQSIELDTGRLAEVQSCLSHLKLQPPRAVFPCWLSLWLRLASAPLNSSSWGCCRMLPAILASRSPKAGLLVTGYALSVAFGSPFLAVATARMDRRKALLLLIGIFILGNLLCALAPNYALLMAARIITALCHGAFFGLGAVVAATLVPEQKKAQAIAMMVAGLTLDHMLAFRSAPRSAKLSAGGIRSGPWSSLASPRHLPSTPGCRATCPLPACS